MVSDGDFSPDLASQGNLVDLLCGEAGGKFRAGTQLFNQTPAITLQRVVKEILGQDARELTITIKVEV